MKSPRALGLFWPLFSVDAFSVVRVVVVRVLDRDFPDILVFLPYFGLGPSPLWVFSRFGSSQLDVGGARLRLD